MKKTNAFVGARLSLKSEQLKVLAAGELEGVAGGGTNTGTTFCNNCHYTEAN